VGWGGVGWGGVGWGGAGLGWGGVGAEWAAPETSQRPGLAGPAWLTRTLFAGPPRVSATGPRVGGGRGDRRCLHQRRQRPAGAALPAPGHQPAYHCSCGYRPLCPAVLASAGGGADWGRVRRVPHHVWASIWGTVPPCQVGVHRNFEWWSGDLVIGLWLCERGGGSGWWEREWWLLDAGYRLQGDGCWCLCCWWVRAVVFVKRDGPPSLSLSVPAHDGFRYPEAQAAARTCIASIAADRDDGAAFLHAMRGSYIEHFVSETLRVASPAVLGVRRAASAVVVPSSLTGAAPVTIPAGTAVMVHHTSDHFDPELFPEPHRWRACTCIPTRALHGASGPPSARLALPRFGRRRRGLACAHAHMCVCVCGCVCVCFGSGPVFVWGCNLCRSITMVEHHGVRGHGHGHGALTPRTGLTPFGGPPVQTRALGSWVLA
jgi:hypothetical protein